MTTAAQPTGEIGARFERDGFVIVPELFRREETDTIKQEIRQIVEQAAQEARARGEQRPRLLATGVLVGLATRSAFFRTLVRDARLLDLLEPIIGPDILFWSDKVVFKSNETTLATPWHQDWAYWRGIHKTTVWLALDDADESNGCLKLVRGSHRLPVVHDGEVPPGEGFGHRIDARQVDERDVVIAPVRAGGAVVFHDLLLHASCPNPSGRERWAWLPTYKDAQAQDLDYPAMTAATVVRGTGAS